MQKHYTQLLFSFLLILLTCNVYGQGTVKGVILDQEGEALIGATIMVVGTSKGSATDFDGSYEITDIAVGTVTLRASYTGYKTVEETVTIESGKVANIEIIMGEDVAVLDQVVIVGYGTQRKRDLVGNVSKIENKELLDVVVEIASLQTSFIKLD